VIGGAALFAETLPMAKTLHVTHVEGSPRGDVSFPSIPGNDWLAVEREDLPRHEHDSARGTYVKYERRL
jgi:dihydrofolate reductase